MAEVQQIDDTTLKIIVTVDDAVAMIREAASDPPKYTHDIRTLYEKLPEFGYTFFCFYAYDSAALFEQLLPVDPKNFLSFSLDAPDGFFYTLYGGMAGLYERLAAAGQGV